MKVSKEHGLSLTSAMPCKSSLSPFLSYLMKNKKKLKKVMVNLQG